MGQRTKCAAAEVCAPLIKWPGGKRLLLKHILPLVGEPSRYFEPFIGGGALFFALPIRTATLGDNNSELINAYVHVRDCCERVISALRRLGNSEAEYYRARESQPKSDLGRAVRFLYLCRLSFNGIHRTNLRGEFNVPYGQKTHLSSCDDQLLQAASAKLKSAKLRCDDFEDCVSSAKLGDTVYLDPPYTVAHGNNGFVKYNAKIFSWEDQRRLAAVARELAAKGCKVVVSNAHHPSIHALYYGFQMAIVQRHSIMAADPTFRRPTEECLFFNEVAV